MLPSHTNLGPLLIPKASNDNESVSPKENAIAGPAQPRELPKRKSVLAACVNCRELRVKCNGDRPACGTCIKRNLPCKYVTQPSETHHVALRRKNQELEQNLGRAEAKYAGLEFLHQALLHRSEADVSEIIRQLRSGELLSSIIDLSTNADLVFQLKDQSQQRLYFDFPWKLEWPAYLQQSWNPYLISLNHQRVSVTHSSSLSSQGPANPVAEQNARQAMPIAAAHLFDSRIDSATISAWTTVCPDDSLLRAILSAYLKLEYDWNGACFHVDDFLSDLVSGSTNFCSPLLVNTILALGCHCLSDLPSRAEYWNPATLAYKFLAEAKRLWELSQHTARTLCTVQAGVLLFTMHLADGLDAVGRPYIERALNMAQELKLFDPPSPEVDRSDRSALVTAWGIFWTQSNIALTYMWRPMFVQSPKYALPDPLRYSSWYGELQLKYPFMETLCPMHHPSVFKAKMEMAKIVVEMASDIHKLIALGLNAPELRHEQVLDYATRFQEWYEALPAELSAERIITPSQFKLHLYFHEMMMRLANQLQADSSSFNPYSITARACQTVQRSPVLYDTLIRLYYQHHGFRESDTNCAQSLSFFAFMANNRLREARNTITTGDADDIDALRSSLLLAAKGLHDQSQIWALAADVLQILFVSMGHEDRLLLRQYADLSVLSVGGGQLTENTLRRAQSHFPLDVLRHMDNTEEHQIRHFINRETLDASGNEMSGQE